MDGAERGAVLKTAESIKGDARQPRVRDRWRGARESVASPPPEGISFTIDSQGGGGSVFPPAAVFYIVLNFARGCPELEAASFFPPTAVQFVAVTFMVDYAKVEAAPSSNRLSSAGCAIPAFR